MTLTSRDVAQLIDISAVQAPHGAAEICALVESAKKYHFIAVHVLPCWVTYLKGLLADAPGILVGAPVGFPAGAHRTEIKVAEGLSDEHASVLAALRLRLTGQVGKSLEDMLAAAGDLGEGKKLEQLLAEQPPKVAASLDEVLAREPKRKRTLDDLLGED